jgi:adenylate cyclase, class 2
MFEVEIKIKIRSKEETQKILAKLGAKLKYLMKNVDIYYNYPKEVRDFSQTDEALRLRTTFLYDPKTKQLINEQHDLTYKGPKMDPKVKTRVEYVCNLKDHEEMDKIIIALGFNKVITIPKNREVYDIDFKNINYEVLIDDIEGLPGIYLEAELMVAQKEELVSGRQKLFTLIKELGYQEQDSIRKSYLELILDLKKK